MHVSATAAVGIPGFGGEDHTASAGPNASRVMETSRGSGSAVAVEVAVPKTGTRTRGGEWRTWSVSRTARGRGFRARFRSSVVRVPGPGSDARGGDLFVLCLYWLARNA